MQLVRLPDATTDAATDANADAATDAPTHAATDAATHAATDAATHANADAKAHAAADAAANRAADTGTYASADLRTAGLRGFKLERIFGMYPRVRGRIDGSKSYHRACKVRGHMCSGRDGRRRGCSLQLTTLSGGVCAR